MPRISVVYFYLFICKVGGGGDFIYTLNIIDFIDNGTCWLILKLFMFGYEVPLLIKHHSHIECSQYFVSKTRSNLPNRDLFLHCTDYSISYGIS